MKPSHVGALVGLLLLGVLLGDGWRSAAGGKVSWQPDTTHNRVIMVVSGGLFGKDRFLTLEWKRTDDYSPGEWCWCAKVGNKWEKVYPFEGEDETGVRWRKEWLK